MGTGVGYQLPGGYVLVVAVDLSEAHSQLVVLLRAATQLHTPAFMCRSLKIRKARIARLKRHKCFT